MNIVIGYAGFFILGHYVNVHHVTKKQAAWIYIIGIFGAISCIIGTFFISMKSDVSSTMFLGKLGIPVIAMSLAIFTFAKLKLSVIRGRINTLIDILAKNLFGVYLTHAIWLTVLCDNMYVWNLMDHRLLLPIIILSIFILSLVTTILLRQVPFLRKVVE
jgi:peptidoglycan/LPS O-acetylase OafA/YrhL